MLQIVFRSHLTKLLSYTDIKRLCLAAARNNRKVGVSGFMIECGGVFLVSVEGEHRDVDGVLDRIFQYPHHDGIEIVYSEENLGRRRFGAWAMNVMFMDDDAFWQTVFGSGLSCDEILLHRSMEPVFALGLLAMAYHHACSRAKVAASPVGARPGRIPRISHMFRG